MSRVSVPAIVAACVGFILLLLPSLAIAQHDAFVEALAEFTTALPGMYGDEGIAARAGLDRLERGLAEWDRTLREYESNIITIGPTPSASPALEMHKDMPT